MNSRTKLAVVFSVLYICGLVLICVYKLDELTGLKLNELGDYLAGAFGPLALAWLVFGYFQQGDELRQGTEALRLQATELNNSVAQQAKIVAANEISLRNHENSLEPLFKIVVTTSGWDSEGEFSCSFELHNLGEYCEGINVVAELGGREYPTREIGTMFSGEFETLSRSGMTEWEDFILSVRYKSRIGRLGQQSFSLRSYQHEEDDYPAYYAEKHPFLS
ncbi:hypothetical protein ABFV43_18360 [Pseudomonas fulva]|uniref:hypothetical protein n=1 Tax=Pseudomonas fulva TaxID=47880 RepID=UPI0034D4249D